MFRIRRTARAKRVMEFVRVKVKREIIWRGVGPRYCVEFRKNLIKKKVLFSEGRWGVLMTEDGLRTLGRERFWKRIARRM